MVCGKCDARRLAASIDPRGRSSPRRGCHTTDVDVAHTRADTRADYAYIRTSCLTHAARVSPLLGNRPAYTLIPTGSPVPARRLSLSAYLLFCFVDFSHPLFLLSPRRARNCMTSRDLALLPPYIGLAGSPTPFPYTPRDEKCTTLRRGGRQLGGG